jgi:cytochrome c oxidase subunit 4
MCLTPAMSPLPARNAEITPMTDAHTNTATGEAAHDTGGHIVPVRILALTGAALLVLTVITVLVAQIDLGEANIYIALGIAAIKGALVALIFMHLRWDRPFNGIVFIASLVFVALLISLAMTDTAEYQPDMIEGDAPAVQPLLEQLNEQ